VDSYLSALHDMDRQVGLRSTRFACAEGWRRHAHLGFTAEDRDPLTDALNDTVYCKSER
jgi:hypothetical protein